MTLCAEYRCSPEGTEGHERHGPRTYLSLGLVSLIFKCAFVASVLLQFLIADAFGLDGWKKESLPIPLKGPVAVLAASDGVYVYAGSTCQVYSPGDAEWRQCLSVGSAQPFTVGRGFAVADGGIERSYLLDSSGVFLGYEKRTGLYKELSPPPFDPGRGARLVSGEDGFLYAVKGILPGRLHESRLLYRYEIETGKWSELGKLEIVNLPGKYSSGLVSWGGLISPVPRRIFFPPR